MAVKHFVAFLYIWTSFVDTISGQCPWAHDTAAADLQASCLCNINAKTQSLSVQCQSVDFPLLSQALRTYAGSNTVIENLFINDSNIGSLTDFVFKNLKIISLQISGAQMIEVAENAFRGLENTLQSLNLANNELRSVPVAPLRTLRLISQLDLSNNQIKFLPDNAFVTLRLKTLKLSGNNLTFADHCFRGLETSLKNLNLKGCQLKAVPSPVRTLQGLAFLDVAQNKIRDLESGIFESMSSITALNLERNVIQSLDPLAFEGVSDTLSSLSLLNNLLTEFPLLALKTLPKLRVLDLGFNLIRTLPEQAFTGINELTLLALDGNPMATVPEEAFLHLNSSLRGLSIGGRFLTCDCKMRWITQWIKSFDLQVTSRERNPQFCGNPQNLQDKNFYQLNPLELTCGSPEPETEAPTLPPPTTTTTTPSTTTTTAKVMSVSLFPLMKEMRVEGGNNPSDVINPGDVTTFNGRKRKRRPNFPPPPVEEEIQENVEEDQQNGGGFQPRLRPGEIVTSIKMNVGQNSGETPKNNNNIRVPPPVDISSGPSPSPKTFRVPTPVDVSNVAPIRAVADVPPQPPVQQKSPASSSEVVNNNNNAGRIISSTSHLPSSDEGQNESKPFVIQKQQWESQNRDSNLRKSGGQSVSNHAEFTDLPTATKSDAVESAASGANLAEVILRDAYKEENSIVIKWETETSQILGFRVVYRLFGKPEFKQGPPLAPSEREFRIKNVPLNECIVVCIVSLEDISINPHNVPYDQCREIRTEGVGGSKQLDYIIIPASAAIVATVIIAVIIFIACLKTSNKKRKGKILDEKPIHTLSINGVGTLRGAPLASLAHMGLGPMATQKDWDQMSMHSQRTDHSVPRARMYHMNNRGSTVGLSGYYVPEDTVSHISRRSIRTNRSKSASIADLTGKPGYGGRTGSLGKPDMGLSGGQSLLGLNLDGRQSRASRRSSNAGGFQRSTRSLSRLAPASSHLGDDDSLNDDSDDNWPGTSTDNNWTDYDQDIYMHRNPTQKSLGRMSYHRDDVKL